MRDFSNVKILDLANAMAADTPGQAVGILYAAVLTVDEKGNKSAVSGDPELVLDCDDTTWSATGLPIRCGLLMEWLAAEAAS